MFQQRGRLHTFIQTNKIFCEQQQQQQLKQKQKQNQKSKQIQHHNNQRIIEEKFTTHKWAANTKLVTTRVKASSSGARTGINIYKFRLKMANTLSVMTNVLRNVVSKQRRRYKENGFNLDLAYICENIIAMGYPADNLESIYRNPSEHVYKFLEEHHTGHYKIYNLCLERSYDVKKFHGRVAVFPFEDHNPPTIELIQRFCSDVDDWLKADSLNVAAVHCKAGKGRTGTMICCYLLYSGQQRTAEDALAWYDEKRTKDRKGVTIPSQRRYVQYFAKLIRSGIPYAKRTLQFCEIRFTEANLLHNHGTVHCSISMLEDTTSSKVVLLQVFPIDFRKSYTLDLKNHSFCVAGDIKIELSHKTPRKKCFHFWINTFFVQDAGVIEGEGADAKLVYTLSKCEIDDAHKDKEHKNFSEDFKVQLVFYAENTKRAGSQPSISVGQISNHRKSQNARLSQQSGGGGTSSSSSNYQLPQNSSSGSDLNYICDQKSSSSASVSSLGCLLIGNSGSGSGFGGNIPPSNCDYDCEWDMGRTQQQNSHVVNYVKCERTKNVSGYDDYVPQARPQQHSLLHSVSAHPMYTKLNCLDGDNILQKHQLKGSIPPHTLVQQQTTQQQELRHLAMTSTPNHKQPIVAQHKKLVEEHGAGGHPVELVTLGGVAGGKVSHDGMPANITTTAVNRASYSDIQSNGNAAGISNSNNNGAVDKGSSSGRSSSEAIANGISNSVGVAGSGSGSSSKSCSISSQSSSSAPSSAGDLDCEEDWESARAHDSNSHSQGHSPSNSHQFVPAADAATNDAHNTTTTAAATATATAAAVAAKANHNECGHNVKQPASSSSSESIEVSDVQETLRRRTTGTSSYAQTHCNNVNGNKWSSNGGNKRPSNNSYRNGADAANPYYALNHNKTHAQDQRQPSKDNDVVVVVAGVNGGDCFGIAGADVVVESDGGVGVGVAVDVGATDIGIGAGGAVLFACCQASVPHNATNGLKKTLISKSPRPRRETT